MVEEGGLPWVAHGRILEAMVGPGRQGVEASGRGL